jgi:recombination protein RecT
MEAMRGTLTRLEAEFSMALPPQIGVQKFIRTTMTALQMNPDLLAVDRRSVLAACMKAAQDGLLIDGREAALVIFKTKNGPMAQYMPMIGGLLKKLRNSGELSSISAHVAYANDEFRYELGDEERIVHRPHLGGPRGDAIAAYAIARTKDGACYREVMSVEEVEQVRSVSRASNNGPWVSWWSEMARKTVLRRLLKRLPSSADLDAVLAHDNETNDLAPQIAAEQPTVAAPSRLRASLEIVNGTEAPAGAPPEGAVEGFDPAQDKDLT